MKEQPWLKAIRHFENYYSENPETLETNMTEYATGLTDDQRRALLAHCRAADKTNCFFKVYRTAQCFIRLCDTVFK